MNESSQCWNMNINIPSSHFSLKFTYHVCVVCMYVRMNEVRMYVCTTRLNISQNRNLEISGHIYFYVWYSTVPQEKRKKKGVIITAK
jgi:hypothetical protein